MIWPEHYADNDLFDYRFIQRGTGIGGSDAPLEIRWFMNRDFRLALLRNWMKGTPDEVIDFTRYDLPAEEPRTLTRNWSLLGKINQKQTRPQDRPVPPHRLEDGDKELIRKRLPELSALLAGS